MDINTIHNEIMKAITYMIYEPELIEGSPKWGDYGGFTVRRRFVLKTAGGDPLDQGYELFTTVVNDVPYIGVYRTWYGEYGEHNGTVDAIIRLNSPYEDPTSRRSDWERLPKWIDPIISFWEEA